MIHVGTAEDVIGSMADGWHLWGRREAPPKRGYTYWLRIAGPYAQKRVSSAIVVGLIANGYIAGAVTVHGDLVFRLADAPAQERLLELGA